MDFATFATTASLISNAISSTKNARDLAKDTDDLKLKQAISDVHDSLLDLKARVSSLDDENRELRTQLARKAAYFGPIPPHGYVYADSDKETKQHPLCPRCYQSEPSKIGYMSELFQVNGGNTRRRCGLCDSSIDEVRGKQQSAPRMPDWRS